MPGLAIAVILGSESRRTRDHILLSKIWDSPNLEGQSLRNGVTLLFIQTLGVTETESQSYVATNFQSADYLGVGHPSRHMARFLLLSDSWSFVYVGRPAWREDESVAYNGCWASSEQLFSSPSILLSKFWDSPNLED
jgi:hypothetical protein